MTMSHFNLYTSGIEVGDLSELQDKDHTGQIQQSKRRHAVATH